MLTKKSDMKALLLSSTFLQAWVSPYPQTLNTPGWSLSVEMFFYLTFPLLLFLIRRYNIKTLSFGLVALSLYIGSQVVLSKLMVPPFYKGYPSFSHDIVYYFPLSHYCSFLLGMAGGLLYIRNKPFFSSQGIRSYAILVGGVVTTYYLLQYPGILRKTIGYPLAYCSSFYAVVFTGFILALSFSRNYIAKGLSFPALIFLGEISYCLYILQYPAHIIYYRYISPLLHLKGQTHFYIYLSFLIILSSIIYLFFEKPLNNLFSKIKSSTTKRNQAHSTEQVTAH